MLAYVFSFSNSSVCLANRRLCSCTVFFVTVMHMRIAPLMLLIAGIVMVTMPVYFPPASAAEWSMTPALRLSYEQNDNIRMTLQPHDTVHGSIIAPRLDMSVRAEVWGVTGSAEIARKRYSGEPDLGRDFETFKFLSFYRMERSNFAVNASRVNDATILGDTDDPDQGRVTVLRSRRTESIQPTWNWSMTERSQLQLGYQFSEVSYAGGESIGLYDYQNRAATATWSYMLSPQSQVFITANYSQYRVPVLDLQSQLPEADRGPINAVSDVDSRTRSFRVGFGHIFSETMQGTLMVGQRRTSTERTAQTCFPGYSIFTGEFVGYFDFLCTIPVIQSFDDSGTTFSGDLKKQFEKYHVTATASRDIAASGTGSQVEWDALSLRIDRPFTARLKGVLNANSSESSHIADISGVSADIKQYSIQPALHWDWTQDANLIVAYRYRHLKRDYEDQAAQSRAILLTLTYTWPKLSVSR